MHEPNLKAQWEAFCELPFPSGCAGEQVEGIDLATLDTFAAGCVDTLVNTPRKHDPECNRVLADCLSELELVVVNTDEEASAYFERLRTLVKSVLDKQ